MDLSKTTKYALKILSYMANNEGSIINAKILHKKLKIPYPYLRGLMTKLSRNGLIKSEKGRGGGFVFAKKTSTIYLSDILAAAGEKEILSSCIFGFDNCAISKKCILHDRWAEAKENVLNILKSTNLEHLKTKTIKPKHKKTKK